VIVNLLRLLNVLFLIDELRLLKSTEQLRVVA